MMEKFYLERFIKAQNTYHSYDLALSEVRRGRKMTHWIWYIFPQIAGLGISSNSRFYAIASLHEAEAYLKNETLAGRLYEITDALLQQESSAECIFGEIDSAKVCSCMTLFDIVSPNDKFGEVLEKFYEGKRCRRTIDIVGA